MDRLNTRNILKRKNFTIQDSNYNCVLCSTILMKLHITSSLDVHLVKNVGRGLVCKWNSLLPFYDMLSASKISFHKQFFMEVFIVSTWCIQKQRNGFVFDNRPPTIGNWKSKFIHECFLQAHRFSQTLKSPFLEWVNSRIQSIILVQYTICFLFLLFSLALSQLYSSSVNFSLLSFLFLIKLQGPPLKKIIKIISVNSVPDLEAVFGQREKNFTKRKSYMYGVLNKIYL